MLHRIFSFPKPLLLIAFFLNAHLALAHPQLQFTKLNLVLEPSGNFHAELEIDVIGFALGKKSRDATNVEADELLNSQTREDRVRHLSKSRDLVKNELSVATDVGMAQITAWEFPSIEDLDDALENMIDTEPFIFAPVRMAFSGTLPQGAHSLTIHLPEFLGDSIQTYELPNGAKNSAPVSAGHLSGTIHISQQPWTFTTKLISFCRYVGIGFQHIVPEGLDHILFVLGLFLLSPRLTPLLWQVSAFTIAHSVTLGLSIYGVFRLPPSIVEPVIAASIVFIAVENLFTSELKSWRPFVVFLFGLVHGLGFASAFAQVGLPRQDFFVGLIGFNVGVECGQFTVIALAFLLVGWFRLKAWYRRVIVLPASAIIALTALFWTVQRIFF